MGILNSPILAWDMRNIQLCQMFAAGTKAIGFSFDDNIAAIENAAAGTVSLKVTAHGMSVSSHIIISGTTNYDGCHIIQDANPESDSNHFSILATYVAEDIQDTASLIIGVAPGVPFRIIESRLHLGAAGGAVENYTITLDSGHPAAAYHDITLATNAMNAATQAIDDWSDKLRFFNTADLVYYAYPNTGGPQTWGLEVNYAVLSGDQTNIF